MSLSTRLQVLLAVSCLATGHSAALVATPCLLALVALRAWARRRLQTGPPSTSRAPAFTLPASDAWLTARSAPAGTASLRR